MNSETTAKEPSLGPACLVVTILCLAAGAAICGFGSWFVFNNQHKVAAESIKKQLIPWVEHSQLSPDDKNSIVNQLDGLVAQLETESFDKQQLSRLHSCMTDNPVFFWGEIQALERRAQSELSDTESEAIRRLNQRLLLAVADRKIGRVDLEYVMQPVVKPENLLEVIANPNKQQIQIYMQRADALLTRQQIPNEPYEKTPAEVLTILVRAALDLPKQN